MNLVMLKEKANLLDFDNFSQKRRDIFSLYQDQRVPRVGFLLIPLLSLFDF